MNGTFEATTTNALRGLSEVDLQAPGAVAIDRLAPTFGALNQDADTWTGHLGVSLNRDIKTWRLALTGNYDHADSRSANDCSTVSNCLPPVAACVKARDIAPKAHPNPLKSR